MLRQLKKLPGRIPIVLAARTYQREDLPHDLVAGLTLGVVTVPQAIAYAFLAGLPPQAGLYACLAPMVIYAVLGSSRQLVVGPVAIAALMVAAAIGEHAPAHAEQHLGIATVLSLQAGLFLWLLRLLRVGGIVSLLSHPVITGFVNAAALLIVVSQLAPLGGVVLPADGGAVRQLFALASALGDIEPLALAIGAASLATLWLVRRFGTRLVPRAAPDHPLGRTGPMLVAGAATLSVALLHLDVATVGFVPAGLPSLTAPPFDADLWWDLAPHAALIALIAYVESYSVGKTLAGRGLPRINGLRGIDGTRGIDGNQELLALGAANVGAAFFGAYPVAGSFTRSSINQAAGSRTPLSVLICALVIVAALLWFAPLFHHLPRAALAAIVIASVWSLIDFRSISLHWRFYRPDVITHFVTLGAVLALGVEAGLLLGMAASIALLVRGSSQPHIAVIGRLGDTAHFRNVERYSVHTWPQLVAARVDESLYFANANQIEDRLAKLAEGDAVQHLLIVMNAVNFIDTSGLEMLQRLVEHLKRQGVAVHLCEVKGPVRDQLAHIAVASWLSGQQFQTTDEAFTALTSR